MKNITALTWHDLYKKSKPLALNSVERDTGYARDLVELNDDEVVDSFAGLEFTITNGLALLDPAKSSELIELLVNELQRACNNVTSDEIYKYGGGYSVLHVATILRGSGLGTEIQISDAWLNGVLSSRTLYGDKAHRTFAFIALSLGKPALAMKTLKTTLMTEWLPNQTFEFNIFEFIRYLASAMENEFESEDIQPAINEFIELFPLHLAASAATFADLFHVSRINAQIRGTQMNSVNDDLHLQIQNLIKS